MKITSAISFGLGSALTMIAIKELGKSKVKRNAEQFKNKLMKILD